MATPRWIPAPRAASLAALAAGLLACLTCNYGEVVVVQPAAAGRGPLTLSIQVDPEDSAVARALGWTAGIPNADVVISPGAGDTATGPPIATLQSDADGNVTVPDLRDGKYLVEVRRLLGSAEMAKLAAGEEVVGFMEREMAQRGAATIRVPASRRRSIVISEWAFQPQWVPTANAWYHFGGYLELANNSDTTVYLDGLVVGEAFAIGFENFSGACEAYESQTNDPDGLWARYLDSLPGTGRDHPLAPGAVAVIATDAVNHTAISPDGLDLSHADFEFIGSADVDNPNVPNAVSIGLEDCCAAYGGHGLILNEVLEEVAFISLPVDTAALPRWADADHRYERVPRARVLDVVALLSSFQGSAAPCPRLVHPNFDRYRGRFGPIGANSLGYNPEGLYSVQRKVAYVRVDGRAILQHTRTTNTDFFYGLRTPFRLP